MGDATLARLDSIEEMTDGSWTRMLDTIDGSALRILETADGPLVRMLDKRDGSLLRIDEAAEGSFPRMLVSTEATDEIGSETGTVIDAEIDTETDGSTPVGSADVALLSMLETSLMMLVAETMPVGFTRPTPADTSRSPVPVGRAAPIETVAKGSMMLDTAETTVDKMGSTMVPIGATKNAISELVSALGKSPPLTYARQERDINTSSQDIID